MIEVADKKNLEKSQEKWLKILQKAVKELHFLTTSTEGEFLSIGGSFQDFWMRADEMSQISSSAAELMSGREIRAAVDGLESLVEQIKNYMDRCGTDLDTNTKRLTKIKSTIETILRPLESFKRIVKTMKMMSIATRIESSRLGRNEAGFNTLADEIKKLATRIAHKSGDIMEQGKNLSEIMGKSCDKVAALQGTSGVGLHKNLLYASDSVLSMREMNNAASVSTKSISEQNKKIYMNVEEVITSIQFHDITRQQIEHVESALNDTCKWLKSSSEKTSVIFKTGEVCKLQRAQLSHSMKEILNAVNSIKENLRGISGNVSDMIKETAKMIGDVNRTGSSTLIEIERHISSVTSSLVKSSEEYGKLSSVLSESAKNAKKMTSFVNDITETGAEIELIALNARIKANHTGDKGAAMGAIAEAIQQLSIESKERTIKILDVIGEISLYAEEMFDDFKDNNQSAQVETMVGELKSLISSMNRVNDRVISYMKQLEEAGKTLAGDIDSAVFSINVHNEMAEVIEKVLKDIDIIINETKSTVSISASDKEKYLKELAVRYTMDSERLIHQSAFGSKKQSGNGKRKKAGLKNLEVKKMVTSSIEHNVELFGDDSSMGDNIELFGNDSSMGDNIEMFGDDSSTGDNVELFGNDSSMDDNVELFGDDSSMDDNVELFGDDSSMGDNVELFGDDSSMGDNVELFGDDSSMGDNVELFGDDSSMGDNVELFGDDSSMGDNVELFGDDSSMGDNVELFGDDSSMGDNMELFGTDSTSKGSKTDSSMGDNVELFEEDEDLGDNVELF